MYFSQEQRTSPKMGRISRRISCQNLRSGPPLPDRETSWHRHPARTCFSLKKFGLIFKKKGFSRRIETHTLCGVGFSADILTFLLRCQGLTKSLTPPHWLFGQKTPEMPNSLEPPIPDFSGHRALHRNPPQTPPLDSTRIPPLSPNSPKFTQHP